MDAVKVYRSNYRRIQCDGDFTILGIEYQHQNLPNKSIMVEYKGRRAKKDHKMLLLYNSNALEKVVFSL